MAHTLVQVIAEGDQPIDVSVIVGQRTLDLSERILVKVDPERAPEWSGGEIAYVLKRLRGPTLLVAQGKAAADTLELLLTEPMGLEHVTEFIAYRGWIGGRTETASDIEQAARTQPRFSLLSPYSQALPREVGEVVELALHAWDPHRQDRLALSSAHRKMRLRLQKKALQNLSSHLRIKAVGYLPQHQIPEQPFLPETPIAVSL